MVARGLILVHTGQAVAEQSALDVVLRCGAGPFQIDGRESFVDRTIQAQRAARHGYPLGFLLGLIADGVIRRHGVENARLRAGQVQLLKGHVIETQGILRGARPGDRQQSGQRRLVGSQPGTHPGGQRLGRGRSACFPGVKVFNNSGDGGVLNGHDRQTPPNSRVPQRSGVKRIAFHSRTIRAYFGYR
jgi:hypothetical protein